MTATQEDMFRGEESTRIEAGGQAVRLDREDARAIGRALVTFLRAAPPETRDELLPWVEHLAGWISPDGLVRVGRWVLHARGEELVLLLYPEKSLGEPPYTRLATVERRDGGWVVAGLRREHLVWWR